jgi:hypothetical protein
MALNPQRLGTADFFFNIVPGSASSPMAHRSSVRINALRQLQKAFRLSLYARHHQVTIYLPR